MDIETMRAGVRGEVWDQRRGLGWDINCLGLPQCTQGYTDVCVWVTNDTSVMLSTLARGR